MPRLPLPRKTAELRPEGSGSPGIPSELARAPEDDPVDAALAELFAGYAERAVALAAEIEVARIRAHFDAVLAELRARDVSDLAPRARAAREAHIARLEVYRDAGVFPKNPRFSTFEPYFVDDVGTRCAMAHLVESSGGGDYVARVAREKNFARIKELAEDPELGPPLLAWLEENGLSAEEAARIQPTYCPQPVASCFCIQTSGGNRGVVELEGIAFREEPPPDNPDAGYVTLISTLIVRAIHGDAGNIAVGDELELRHTKVQPGTLVLGVVGQMDEDLGRPYVGVAATAPVQDGRVACGGPFTADGYAEEARDLSLSKEEAVEALLADSCENYMAGKDPAFTEEPPCDRGDVGCAAGGELGPGATSLALSLLALLLARRLGGEARGRS